MFAGDVQYKPFVSSDAEVIQVDLDGTEEYLVLACDGLWDALTPQELPQVVFNYMSDSGGNVGGIAKHLVQYAKDNESMDNISVIVIAFRENLTEPVSDAGFFNFLSGGASGKGGDNSQGSSNSGNKAGDIDKSGAGNQNSGDTSVSGGNLDGSQNKNMSLKDDAFPSDINLNNEVFSKQPRGLREMSRPELLININHMSFDIGPQIQQEDSTSFETSTERETTTEIETDDTSKIDDEIIDTDDSSKRDEDLDYYGVFNTRLVDGPIDLSRINDVNSSALLKDIADDVYNKTPLEVNNEILTISKLRKKNIFLQGLDQDLENSLHNYLSTESYNMKKKKMKKSRNESRNVGEKKEKGKSPVCWAFTGKNRATVQNYKLNMAAKTFNKGSNQLPGEVTPRVKPLPSKFAQIYSSTENVHDIANLTMNPGKLESLPPPRPKVLPGNLAQLSGSKVYGSKSQLQKETQKFHTSWRPRKPLKPIASVVYETPPTPFVNNKLQGLKQ